MSDPAVVHQFGLLCVGRSDGCGMMQAGWALWGLVGLHDHQAKDLLMDGYTTWRDAGADASTRLVFTADVYQRAAGEEAHVPGDPRRLPPELWLPAADVLGMRSWSGLEMLAAAQEAGRSDIVVARKQEVYQAISTTDPYFLQARALAWANAYASHTGLTQPFR